MVALRALRVSVPNSFQCQRETTVPRTLYSRLYLKALSLSGRLPQFRASSQVRMSSTGEPAGTGVSVVYVTVPQEGDTAKKLAGSIIEHKLAACVNILPGVTSVYWWEGKVEDSQEQLLIIKTQTSLLRQLTKHVQALHPYDECEVISLPVTGGSSSYLKWVIDSTAGTQ